MKLEEYEKLAELVNFAEGHGKSLIKVAICNFCNNPFFLSPQELSRTHAINIRLVCGRDECRQRLRREHRGGK